ncbi:MAG: SWIM zinc finger family protein [Porphyrobacter sp.]|nr:SWIM zinc finger family protein [Porphyrobacter sp.]
MSNALDFTYRYETVSCVTREHGHSPRLMLATFNPDHAPADFFDGALLRSRLTGQILFTLSEIVRTRFWEPVPAGLSMYDPVLTSHPGILRLEGFSGCCGVYARADLPAALFDAEIRGRGTTNVDFNDDMRRNLLALRDGEDVRLSIGTDKVVLTRGDQRVVERKVKLPLRWIKGFSEAQAYLARLKPHAEVPAAAALQLLRTLPRAAKPPHSGFVVASAGGLRLTQRASPGAVPVIGTHRIRVIEPLLPFARRLRIWFDPESGASGWELMFEEGSFFLLLSPALNRGFSGEGQILATLAAPPPETLVAQVRAQLVWQARIAPAALAASIGSPAAAIADALAVIGSRGLAGFDAAAGHYFHRELPFHLSRVEAMQPRLAAARKLVAARAVRCLPGDRRGERVFEVEGRDTLHRVRLTGEGARCACRWFSTHQGQRGPCKHILAAQMIDSEIADGAHA